MRILLFGEYSNFHSTLKAALEKNGHSVLLSGRKDGFKDFKLDISLEPKLFMFYPLWKLKNLLYLLFKFDISLTRFLPTKPEPPVINSFILIFYLSFA